MLKRFSLMISLLALLPLASFAMEQQSTMDTMYSNAIIVAGNDSATVSEDTDKWHRGRPHYFINRPRYPFFFFRFYPYSFYNYNPYGYYPYWYLGNGEAAQGEETGQEAGQEADK
jgi:hypothetical protein